MALGTDDIYATVDRMRARGVQFQDTPDTYYEAIDARVPGHGEDLQRLRERRILIDGAPTQGQGLLLQIFTQNLVGPCFFEIIQRKGNEGFGEGNFKALFESLELDQMRRGASRSTSRRGGSRMSIVHASARRGRPRRRCYQSGFGNQFATEALPGALPAHEFPAALPLRPVRRAALGHGLHRAARANRRSWLYRIRPAAQCTGRFARSRMRGFDTHEFDADAPPDQLRWDPLPLPDGRRPISSTAW